MSPISMSKIEAAIRTVIDLNTAFNQHNAVDMAQLLSDDCQFESAGPAPDGTVYRGKEAITKHWSDFFHRFPNALIEIEEIFSAGYRCIMRWKIRTDLNQEEDYIRGIDLFRVQDGAIREILSYRKA